MRTAFFIIGFLIFFITMIGTTFAFWKELSIITGAGFLMGYAVGGDK